MISGDFIMKETLAFGREYIEFEVPAENLINKIEGQHFTEDCPRKDLVQNALDNPIKSEKLRTIIKKKKAQNAVVVVNDITRPTPYELILPPLLSEIEEAGIQKNSITLVIATGIHRAHTADDNRKIFGLEICNNYRIENHNSDNNLISMGLLSNGMELVINRTVAEADMIITTGMVNLHYFAGYSGGRKSILPGVAGRKLIEANHSMMDDERACLGNYHNNPVSDIMIEAARRCRVDFILNVVTGSKHDITFCAAGDLEAAWIEAVKFCEKKYVVSIPQKSDIVIAGCGGYPKDINIYQAQKALDAAVLAVKDGGTIILAAECSEGLGEDTFEEWIKNAKSPQDIVNRFHNKFELGGHKAFAIVRTLEKADILLLSNLSDETVNEMFLTPVHNMEEAIAMALDKHGRNARISIMPEAPKIGIKVTDSSEGHKC